MSQRPSLAMPMGTSSKRLLSIAAITEAAPARDTSCSPERPPKTTPTRSFRGFSAMNSVVSDPAFPGELLDAHPAYARFCFSRHARHLASRSAISFSAPRSVGR